jgi:tRNA A37 threonylcarbamoyladenosine biosynthesis protein TsaE
MDLYRLSGASKDLLLLDLQHVFANCMSLIEWPQRLGEANPTERLDIRITIPKPLTEANHEETANQNGEEDCPRHILLQPHGNGWSERIQYMLGEGYIDDLLLSVNE